MKYNKNVFFYKDAANTIKKIERYTKEFLKVLKDDTELFRFLAIQIYANNKIINHTFMNVHKAIVFFDIRLSLAVITSGLFIIQPFFKQAFL